MDGKGVLKGRSKLYYTLLIYIKEIRKQYKVLVIFVRKRVMKENARLLIRW